MSEEVNVTPEAEASEGVQLSLQDLATVVQIVDICSRRGAFEGPELEAVGGLRSRIVAFVNASAPKDGEVPEGQVPVADAEEEPAE
tara:strand:- start:1157 stop:1414 length:258 start_codon:yes stop_codon:yes gene_type:complete